MNESENTLEKINLAKEDLIGCLRWKEMTVDVKNEVLEEEFHIEKEDAKKERYITLLSQENPPPNDNRQAAGFVIQLHYFDDWLEKLTLHTHVL